MITQNNSRQQEKFKKSDNNPDISSLPDNTPSISAVLRIIIELRSRYNHLYPCHKLIGSLCRFKPTAVKLALKYLRDHGFLWWNKRYIGSGRNKKQLTNEYFLHPSLISQDLQEELFKFMKKALFFITYLTTQKRAMKAKIEECLLNNKDINKDYITVDSNRGINQEDWLLEGEKSRQLTFQERIDRDELEYNLRKSLYG